MNSLHKRLTVLARSQSRLQWLYILTTVGLLIGLLISLPAWSAVRSYPLVPLLPAITLPPLAHSILLLLLVTALLAGLRYRTYQFALGLTALLSLTALSVLDVTRFQPWVFYYLAILLLCVVGLYKDMASIRVLDAARIAVGGMYLWSGLQKLNVTFMGESFPWFTQALWTQGPGYMLSVFIFLGLLVPFLEIALGLGLFARRTRNLAILGSFGMMALVLLSLGPLGNNWNAVVWPWNVALFLSVIILFWRTDFTLSTFLIRQKTNLLGLVVFAVFWLLPIGNIFGAVDHYLSWSLYSGRPPEAALIGDTFVLESLSPRVEDDRLPFIRWTLEELQIVPYPEERIFKSVFADVCSRLDNHPSLQLEIKQSVSYWNTQKTFSYTSCSDI